MSIRPLATSTRRPIYLVVGKYHVEIDAAAAATVLTAMLDARVYEEGYDPRENCYDRLLTEQPDVAVSVGTSAAERISQAEHVRRRAEAAAAREQRTKAPTAEAAS